MKLWNTIPLHFYDFFFISPLVDNIGRARRTKASREVTGQREVMEQKDKRHSFLDLFRTPNLRRKKWISLWHIILLRGPFWPGKNGKHSVDFMWSFFSPGNTLLLTFVNFGNLAVYSGLSYYGPMLSPSPHLGFLLSSLVELPGYLFVQFTADRFGRRMPQIFCMLCGGVACIFSVVVPDSMPNMFMVFCLMGKLFINISYIIAELMEGTEHNLTFLDFSCFCWAQELSCVFYPFLYVSYAFSWFFMVLYGFLRFFMVFYGFFLVFYGFFCSVILLFYCEFFLLLF